MTGFVRYPDLPDLPSLSRDDEATFQFWWAEVVRELEQRDGQTFFGAANVSVYDISASTTPNRSFVISTSAAVTATYDLLTTLIRDLRAKGILA